MQLMGIASLHSTHPTAKTAIIDPAWQSFSVEVYLFVGMIYFAFCFAMSRYSRRLEAQTRSM
jgi:general L-amino acid transport system permease protein